MKIIKRYKKIKDGRRYIMDKKTQEINVKAILDIIENDSSNSWDNLCEKCSSLVKDAQMTEEEIDAIVRKCKV